MITLGHVSLNAREINKAMVENIGIVIASDVMENLTKTYNIIEKAADSRHAIYGLNTGFGALAEKRIDASMQDRLQRNIIISHAVGVGEPLDFFTAKTLMLLRLMSLLQNYSGASPALVTHLAALINANCAPFIPRKGSVGASGDLAPLAHLGLLLLGIGEGYIDHQPAPAIDVLAHAHLSPLSLGLRDGLALINGTQAMAAVAINALRLADNLGSIADIAASISCYALHGHASAFDERIARVKPHPGQIKTAERMRKILSANYNLWSENKRTQDPYSLRCVPQVHGAMKDVCAHVHDVTNREINSVTDNPLIFLSETEDVDVVSGGNFHGQHLAYALDYLAFGLTGLAAISERRLELLLNPHQSNGLPPFLIENSGVNSGYMLLHVTASSLVSENKILSHPASVDSIPTSAGREDHVSMGMNSANKILQIIENTKIVLAIELLGGFQALDFRSKPLQSDYIQALHQSFREVVPFRSADGLYRDDLLSAVSWLESLWSSKNFAWLA